MIHQFKIFLLLTLKNQLPKQSTLFSVIWEYCREAHYSTLACALWGLSVRRTSQVEPSKSSRSLLLGKTGFRFIDLEA